MLRRTSLAGAAGLSLVVNGLVLASTLNVPAEYPTIQAAVDAAVDGDEVVIAPGNYSGRGNHSIDFAGKSITVRGAEGAANTIIDGELDATIFFFNDGEGPDAVVEGLTLTRGFGGTIRCFGSSPTIRNCILTNGYGFDWGSGIYADGSASKVTGCVFSANYTDWFGAAIMLSGDDDMEISDCVFSGNVGWDPGAGAVIIHDSSHASITNCVFAGNTDAAISVNGSAEITNCLFSGNAQSAISAGSAALTITNCTFRLNTGSVGGLHASSPTNSLIANCIFWNNANADIAGPAASTFVQFSIVEGGWAGAGNLDADPLFSAGPSGNWTSPVAFDPLTNITTFTDANANLAPGALVGLQFNPDLSQSQHLHIWANTATTISALGNLASGPFIAFGLDGNEAYQVYDSRVLGGSPAIDAGNNSVVPADITTDLDDNPRFVDDPATPDTGLGTPPLVDIGAYEFKPIVAGDATGDGVVDIDDLLSVINLWGPCASLAPPGAPCPADLNGDSFVDVSDLLIVINNWT